MTVARRGSARYLLARLALALLAACGSPPDPAARRDDEAAPGQAPIGDAGADAEEGCGLSFGDALDAYAPERVCQTTVYNPVTGYCTHWVACSSL